MNRKKPNIYHVLSQYPNVSITFIIREIKQLKEMGSRQTICRLKWGGIESKGKKVEGIQVTSYQTNPFKWVRGAYWLALNKQYKAYEILKSIINADETVWSKIKLLIIMLNVANLSRLINENDEYPYPDHIRSYFLGSNAIAAMWLSRLVEKSKYSVTVYTKDIWISKTLIDKAIRNASFCTVTTQETYQLISSRNIDEEKIVRVNQAIPIGEFDYNNVGGNRQSMQRPISILGVGRLIEKKGFDTLVRCCKKLERREIDVRCNIIGGGSQKGALKTLIKSLNMNDKIYLEGAKSFTYVKKKMSKADFMVVPSREGKGDSKRDGLPTVVLESMALGTPVIASRFAGIPDAVDHGVTGMLCEPQSPIEFADTIEHLIKNRKLASKISRQAREKIELEFSLKNEVDKLFERIRTHG